MYSGGGKKGKGKKKKINHASHSQRYGRASNRVRTLSSSVTARDGLGL